MSYTKEVICLAASRKHSGYCFAGKDIKTGEWIRPVSDRPDEEISDEECALSDGAKAELLDILEIPLIKEKPLSYQTENHLIDPSNKWKKIGRGTWKQVDDAIDDHRGPLWLNQGASWGYTNNRVAESGTKILASSLILIRPEKISISVGPKGGLYDRKKRIVKANFSHDKCNYVLAVTDSDVEERFSSGKDRTEYITDSVLCIRLGEIYRGHAYKLVAAVIEP